jgi:hypothetical protein
MATNTESFTLADLKAQLQEFREETKNQNNKLIAQNEQLVLRMEAILTRNPKKEKPVKPVDVKTTDTKEEEVLAEGKAAAKPKKPRAKAGDKKVKETAYINAMYWYMDMYATKNPFIAHTYNQEVVAASEAAVRLKNPKIQDDAFRKAVGSDIWKSFDKKKKEGLKISYNTTWKQQQEKHEAKDLDNDVDTDGETVDADANSVADDE